MPMTKKVPRKIYFFLFSFLVIIFLLFLLLKSYYHSKSKEKVVPEVNNLPNYLVIYQDEASTYLTDTTNNIYKYDNLDLTLGQTYKIKFNDDSQANITEITRTDAEFNLDSLFSKYTSKAEEIVVKMSLEEVIGQLLLVHYDQATVNDLNKYYFGGFVLFADAFKDKSKEAVIKMTSTLQTQANIPLLLAVDEEGGSVVRVSSNKALSAEKFLSPRNLYQKGGMELILADNKTKNTLLASLGLNINLAPVLDISTNNKDYIYSRSIGLSPEETGYFAKAVIESSQGSAISNVLKHFPGYGANLDTHKNTSIDNRSLDDIKTGLIPFQMGIDAGTEAIMVSHNVVTAFDSENPASISLNIHNYLHQDMAFQGIIMTDDLSMSATKSIKNIGVQALLAGNNILIIKDYAKITKEIILAINKGHLSERYIRELAIKNISWKMYKGLIN